jgi:hypothetical protein
VVLLAACTSCDYYWYVAAEVRVSAAAQSRVDTYPQVLFVRFVDAEGIASLWRAGMLCEQLRDDTVFRVTELEPSARCAQPVRIEAWLAPSPLETDVAHCGGSPERLGECRGDELLSARCSPTQGLPAATAVAFERGCSRNQEVSLAL